MVKLNSHSMHTSQRALVLHRWPYRETSLLLDLLTEQQGRIRLVAKGARRRNSTLKGCLQAFTPLQVRWFGNSEIKTLLQAEPLSLALPLVGRALYSGLYVNELLYRLLVVGVPYETLFRDYLGTLCQLAGSVNREPILRCFELTLLQAMGYGVDFEHCAESGAAILAPARYRYQAERGFVREFGDDQGSFTGEQLRSFAKREFSDAATLRAAKIFTRLALRPYLGHRPLKSRELFC